jgi:hypothetical protein
MTLQYNPPQQQLAPPPLGSDGSIYGNSNAIAASNAQAQNRAKFGGSKKKIKRGVTFTPALIIIGGKSKKQVKGGAASNPASTITVPPIQVPFKDAGAGNNTVAANVTNSIKVGATLNANSEYDDQVGTNGSQKGGWPEWGCMSGGKHSRKRSGKTKKKSRVNCRKTKKSRKCRRRKR